jgi:hypothetical protein
MSPTRTRDLETTRGWAQGYNAQAVVGERQIVLAAEISVESLDTADLPMCKTAIRELARPPSDLTTTWPEAASNPGA